MKNIRPGFYKAVSDLGATKEGDKAVHFKDQDMSDAPREPGLESKTKRAKEAGDKARRLQDTLKEQGNTQGMLKQILDQPVNNVTVQDLLSASPELQRLFFRERENKDSSSSDPPNPTARVTSVRPEGEDEEESSAYLKELYVSGTLTAMVSINGTKMEALLDSGAECVLMQTELTLLIGLAIYTDMRVGVKGVNKQRSSFAGICEGAVVNFGGIEISIPIFVYDDLEQQLILRRPYYKKARLEMWDNSDGTCDGYVRSIDGEKRVKFRAVIADHPTDRELKSLMKNRSLK